MRDAATAFMTPFESGCTRQLALDEGEIMVSLDEHVCGTFLKITQVYNTYSSDFDQNKLWEAIMDTLDPHISRISRQTKNLTCKSGCFIVNCPQILTDGCYFLVIPILLAPKSKLLDFIFLSVDKTTVTVSCLYMGIGLEEA